MVAGTTYNKFFHGFSSQKIQYFTHAKSSTKTSDKIVLKQEYLRGCEAGGEKDIDVNILVPTVPPSQDTICNIIKIKYFIRVSEGKVNLLLLLLKTLFLRYWCRYRVVILIQNFIYQ